VTDPNGNATTTAYYDSTGDGRLKSISDAGNHQIGMAYDANGNPTAVTVTGSDGLTTRTTNTYYDELDRPLRIVGPQYSDAALGIIRPVTQYVYDTLGNRSQVLAGYTSDATGANAALDVLKLQTTVAWDDFGRKIKETDPLNQAWSNSYDANNNLITTVDPLNQTTTLNWGYGHQLLTVRDQAGNTTGYTRNALGQITVALAPGVAYRYGYDTSHRLSSLSDSRGNKTLSYAYSPGGMMNWMQDSDGNRTDYLYDPVGRLSGIWAANYDYVSFSYDPGGRLSEKMYSSGADSRYTYNPDNSLAGLTNKQGVTTISSHVYGYDVLGNRATQTETIGATTINYAYSYDALNRLTQVQNGTTTQQENYTFDPLGNRLTKSIGVTTPAVTAYVYDAANQLKEIRSGTTTGALLASLAYDADGNLKSRSDTGLTLTYDALNRLTQASLGVQTQSYAYDDQGRRISKTIGTSTTNFLYSGADIVSEYGATWGLPIAQYTHGTRVDDITIRATATSAQYFHLDGLGSVVGVTNNAGLTDATQRFDAWGNKIASTGATPRYGYTGREPDETGLVFYRARYYDPTVGRFTQRDPIGLRGGLNRYAYVGGIR
ncbi:MAG: RHS repeat-associated core domain-containing protein, partial [Nitrosomonadales bacterium]|nr:RHS repeat-associated core domain-containing protein [Nitrosomonadales bacterium]